MGLAGSQGTRRERRALGLRGARARDAESPGGSPAARGHRQPRPARPVCSARVGEGRPAGGVGAGRGALRDWDEVPGVCLLAGLRRDHRGQTRNHPRCPAIRRGGSSCLTQLFGSPRECLLSGPGGAPMFLEASLPSLAPSWLAGLGNAAGLTASVLCSGSWRARGSAPSRSTHAHAPPSPGTRRRPWVRVCGVL